MKRLEWTNLFLLNMEATKTEFTETTPQELRTLPMATVLSRVGQAEVLDAVTGTKDFQILLIKQLTGK